jgi:preprotein translocase subunit Sec63
MSPPSDEAELSMLVPLGFIALTVWTASWGSSLVRFFSRESSSVATATNSTLASADAKSNKKKNKKVSETNAQPAPTVVETKPASSSNDKWRAIALLVSWALFIVYLASDYGMGQVGGGGYDPYKILNVPETVSKSDLKKLYRDLSKEYHPDRLAGKSEAERAVAEKQFLLISKAYKTLTTEEMMNNWLKFGHPDGPRSISVNVGIPSWMKKPENAGAILLIYLGIFGAVGYFFKNRAIAMFGEIEEVNGKPKSS